MASQMYKVFFKDRIVFLTNDSAFITQDIQCHIYIYNNKEELKQRIADFRMKSNNSVLYIFHENAELLMEEFKSCFLFINAAGGLVYNTKGEFLAIKRRGIWDLPKGKVEKREDPGTAAMREVSEECGLKSLILKKIILKTYHTYEIDHKPVLKETDWFEMSVSGSEKTKPQLKEEITEARWFSRSEGSTIIRNTYPSIIDVLSESGIMDQKK